MIAAWACRLPLPPLAALGSEARMRELPSTYVTRIVRLRVVRPAGRRPAGVVPACSGAALGGPGVGAPARTQARLPAGAQRPTAQSAIPRPRRGQPASGWRARVPSVPAAQTGPSAPSPVVFGELTHGGRPGPSLAP